MFPKYRIYNKKENKFYEVGGINFERDLVQTPAIERDNGERLPYVFPFSEVVFLESTGKQSKEGDIYEWDIVNYGDGRQFFGVVRWDYTKLTWIIRDQKDGSITLLSDIASEGIDVVGNLFQKATTGE